MHIRQGRIFVISAPSGSGKTTLCSRLVKRIPNLVQSVSMTTRKPRAREKRGADYYFVTLKEFKKNIAKNKFLEWAKNFGNYYGTPRRFVKGALRKKKDVMLLIDVKGAMQIKKKCPSAIFIFIAPPSVRELEERLKRRNTEHASLINTRLKVARKEIVYISRYDYVIVNDSIKKALEKLEAIITAERCRICK